MDSRRDPLLVAGYAVAAAAIVLLDPPSILAIVIAAPLVLLAPGLSLVMALRIDRDSTLPARRLIVSIALSIALAALGGILINAVAPLTKASWLLWLVGFTCVCSAIALLGAGRARTTPLLLAASWLSDQLRVQGLRRWVAAGVAVLFLAGAAVVTEITTRNAYDTPLTALSIQAVAGTGGKQVELSVINQSNRAEDLHLTIFDGRGSTMVEKLKLQASRRWMAAEPIGSSGLRAVLRKAGQRKPIAEVIWNGLTPRHSPA
jgi:hypothetical protein